MCASGYTHPQKAHKSIDGHIGTSTLDGHTDTSAPAVYAYVHLFPTMHSKSVPHPDVPTPGDLQLQKENRKLPRAGAREETGTELGRGRSRRR